MQPGDEWPDYARGLAGLGGDPRITFGLWKGKMMADTIDTSASAVGIVEDALRNDEPAQLTRAQCEYAADMLVALLRDRDQWKDAARAALQARLDEDMNARARPDIAAILRGEAVAVPVGPTAEMQHAAREWAITKYGRGVGFDASREIYSAMIAASPYAKEAE